MGTVGQDKAAAVAPKPHSRQARPSTTPSTVSVRTGSDARDASRSASWWVTATGSAEGLVGSKTASIGWSELEGWQLFQRSTVTSSNAMRPRSSTLGSRRSRCAEISGNESARSNGSDGRRRCASRCPCDRFRGPVLEYFTQQVFAGGRDWRRAHGSQVYTLELRSSATAKPRVPCSPQGWELSPAWDPIESRPPRAAGHHR